MTWLIIVILIISLAVFITLYFMQLKEVESMSNQLEAINREKTSSRVLLLFSNSKIEKLAQSINRTLEEKEKVEIEYGKMDRELRQAIANMSHDLRTPLTSIMGYIQLIEDDKTPAYEKKQYLDIVKKRSIALQGLIENFYEMSRLEAKEYKFNLKPLNLYNIICELILSFYNDFTNRGIEPIIELEENIPLITADEYGVKRIFSNLIQNMLRYGNKYVYISLLNQNDTIVTTFQNDALELSEEDIPHLFERFFTGDKTRSGKSTGLGLSITRQLVEQMGHSIYARLEDGKLSIIIEWKK